MKEIKVSVPAYPYDQFSIELDRSDRGALWRGQCRICDVARTWDGWEVDGATVSGSLTDELITAAIDRKCAGGQLKLTRV
jgi:hypothetical protein